MAASQEIVEEVSRSGFGMTERREASSIASATSSGELLGATKITPPPTRSAACRWMGRSDATTDTPAAHASLTAVPELCVAGSDTTTRAVRSHL